MGSRLPLAVQRKKAATRRDRQMRRKIRARSERGKGRGLSVRKFLRGRARISTGPWGRRGRPPDLHAPDEAALDKIDVLHQLVLDDVSGPVPNDLMHVHHDSARRIRLDAYRLDVRIDHAPLTRPVVANTIVA